MEKLNVYQSVECDPLFYKTERILIIGAINAGKSYFANKLISKHADKFTHIIVCGVYASDLEKCVETKDKLRVVHEETYNPFDDFHIAENMDLKQRHVLIFYDDSMGCVLDSKICSKIFFMGRHYNISVIVTLQNYFYQGKEAQTIRGQASMITLFKIRNMNQVVSIARTIESGKSRIEKFSHLYNKHVLNKRYGYLSIFMDSPPDVRYRKDLVNESGIYDTVLKMG